ncbi:hypothetical protein D8674_000297 [Pyrus ussuriensis x Pyrus communis]|uniref:Aminotransferase-like plant mobile domain-containing protein n=1 Tax=Pyrus ussuriensis x Pyrus communis TaxID=2448454 RepID=A0A5N5F328_9ROSA|nr:hypothetical protein D8674_000297 [Pyrus ussuriensis x Pyrus communis]
MSIHFKFSYGEDIGWANWVNTELSFANQCATLIKAKVLDVLFMNKKQMVCFEPEFLRHMVRMWSIETHTLVCAWGEFTPTMEDVSNIMYLLITGGISEGYATYWLKCFATITNVVSHPRLVLKLVETVSGSKPQCPTATEESNASGDSSRSMKKSRASSIDEGKPTNNAMKHFRPRVVKDGPPSNKPDSSLTSKKSKSKGSAVKPKTAKTPAKEATPTSVARRTRSAQASASSDTPKPPEFLNITKASEEEQNIREADDDEVAEAGLAAKENSNTSADSDLGKGEDSGREPSDKDDSKAADDVNIDQVDGFLNDNVNCVTRTTKDVQAQMAFYLSLQLFLRELGTSLYSMEHTSPLEITEHRLLCWLQLFVAFLGEIIAPVTSHFASLALICIDRLGIDAAWNQFASIGFGILYLPPYVLACLEDEISFLEVARLDYTIVGFGNFNDSQLGRLCMWSHESRATVFVILLVRGIRLALIWADVSFSGNGALMVRAFLLITAMLGCSSMKVSLKPSIARVFTNMLIVPRMCSNTTCLKLAKSFFGQSAVWCQGYFHHLETSLDLAQDQVRVPYDSYLPCVHFPGCGKAYDESLKLSYVVCTWKA